MLHNLDVSETREKGKKMTLKDLHTPSKVY